MYKKAVKFLSKRQKIFWVLVFSFMYLVLVDVMDRSLNMKIEQTFYKNQRCIEIKTIAKMIALHCATRRLLKSFIFGNDHQIIVESLHKLKDEL